MKKIGIIGHVGTHGVARSITQIIAESNTIPYRARPELDMPVFYEPPLTRKERRAKERKSKKS